MMNSMKKWVHRVPFLTLLFIVFAGAKPSSKGKSYDLEPEDAGHAELFLRPLKLIPSGSGTLGCRNGFCGFNFDFVRPVNRPYHLMNLKKIPKQIYTDFSLDPDSKEMMTGQISCSPPAEKKPASCTLTVYEKYTPPEE
ncbi:MAG: hypothetical protein JNL01_15340 [Bdellovibrionales bacterium]|nr:hypothetical protein [Bdellovibrionales bacterium]